MPLIKQYVPAKGESPLKDRKHVIELVMPPTIPKNDATSASSLFGECKVIHPPLIRFYGANDTDWERTKAGGGYLNISRANREAYLNLHKRGSDIESEMEEDAFQELLKENGSDAVKPKHGAYKYVYKTHQGRGEKCLTVTLMRDLEGGLEVFFNRLPSSLKQPYRDIFTSSRFLHEEVEELLTAITKLYGYTPASFNAAVASSLTVEEQKHEELTALLDAFDRRRNWALAQAPSIPLTTFMTSGSKNVTLKPPVTEKLPSSHAPAATTSTSPAAKERIGFIPLNER